MYNFQVGDKARIKDSESNRSATSMIMKGKLVTITELNLKSPEPWCRVKHGLGSKPSAVWLDELEPVRDIDGKMEKLGLKNATPLAKRLKKLGVIL